MSTSSEFVASLFGGAAAGIVVDIALYPIDTVKTMLQTGKRLSDVGGIRGIYRGLSSAAAASAPCAATFFGTYEASKAFLEQRAPTEYAPLCHMAAASMGETATAVIRTPFEIVKQQLQAKIHATPGAAVRTIWAVHGLRGFFTGYGSLVMREVPFSFLQFPMYEQFKKSAASAYGCQVDTLPGPLVAVCGSLAGGVAAAVTTPLDVVKTRIMVYNDSRGMLEVLRHVYATEGMATLFSGIVPRVTWISIGGAVFFGAYETFKRAFLRNVAVVDADDQ
eukprot:TRINITY_DN12464_c0_g1_i1.p2 TRINITY_DN12464_c0_g1~~TRINITY_DN12464_c0_g1_i1.p2  ORF type:complete len:278 (+),score=62.44 TRINITY_DN12464_c0_g1_i1:4909-5742(+)